MFGAPANLNAVFSSLNASRRYEVWFTRLGLSNDSGAWWFRYLLMNPGSSGCPQTSNAAPVQVWATYFPRGGTPQTYIEEFSQPELQVSARGTTPFYFRAGANEITDASSRGRISADGHEISWDLQHSSTFATTLSNKGWIGFSRTPHSDASFSGQISFDGAKTEGSPLGFGLQGHNCGYRHRNFWTWAHAYFPGLTQPSTFEALVYEMPFGLRFRRAVLWHQGKAREFRRITHSVRDSNNLRWQFSAQARDGTRVHADFNGGGSAIHRLPYVKTDCSGTFPVANNSLASAVVTLTNVDGSMEKLECRGGAVVEMVG